MVPTSQQNVHFDLLARRVSTSRRLALSGKRSCFALTRRTRKRGLIGAAHYLCDQTDRQPMRPLPAVAAAHRLDQHQRQHISFEQALALAVVAFATTTMGTDKSRPDSNLALHFVYGHSIISGKSTNTA